MTIKTLARFLMGGREAILQVAGNRRALWVGGLLVVSAGFAREYDHEDLQAEPWYVLIPLGASLITSLLLFALVHTASLRRAVEQLPFFAAYRSFLATYWMTAPLAWLYALPVERLFSEADSTRANLALLALVALWRVVLITRVVQVLFGATIWAAAGLVMFFVDSLALAVLYFTPLPIFNIMGGIRLSVSEQLIQGAAMLVGCFGTLSWLVWLICVMFIFGTSDRSWKPALSEASPSARISWPLWSLVVASLAIWGFVLPITQPEQQLRRTIEQLFAAGRVSEALAMMSQHQADEFPPNWTPPPHLAFYDPKPPLFEVLDLTLTQPVAPWVRQRFVEKLEFRMASPWLQLQGDTAEVENILGVLERLPNRDEVVARNPSFFSSFDSLDEGDELRERARALQAAVEQDRHSP